MVGEDVIELGSSEDETEPPPKKKKPMPDAMVCIPNKFRDVTIKPTNVNPYAIAKGLGKGVTLTKASNSKSSQVLKKSNNNGKPVQKVVMKPQIRLFKPISIQNSSTNPSLKVNIVNPIISRPMHGIKNVPGQVKTPIRIKGAPAITSLPSDITVTRKVQSLSKPIIFMNPMNKNMNKNISQKFVPVPVVTTVELDDDEVPPPVSGPAWYLRPEEQIETPSVEEENNKEPEGTKMIEITIEDSPIKPMPNKRTCEVGSELSITIDDSPIKPATDKVESASGSDNEISSSNKQSTSKKKLEYPKENDDKKTVEIEIEIPPEEGLYHGNSNNAGFQITAETSRKDSKEESVTKLEKCNKNDKDASPDRSTVNKTVEKITGCVESEVKLTTSASSSGSSEFHSVYQAFIDLCFELENSDDMKKIVEKKIKSYFRQVPKEYTESEEFIDMVSSKIIAMKASPNKMYLYIKDIVDELNLQRKLAKSQVPKEETKTEEPVQFSFGDESDYDLKRQRQIRKLEKTIKKLHRAIQKLEEQEVDFDDEDDSVYLLTERYKERMVRVYAKFCQLTNTKMPSEPRIQMDARPGQPSGPAKRLEKWINKKVPIGTPLPFPDFHDVLRCVREANNEDKLGWNEVDIMEEARDLFTRCGRKLQRRRQENEWRLAASRIASEKDPAEENPELLTMLQENRKVAASKETEIFKKFADRQNVLKLEAVEIGDKEAEESPVESEEEEGNDDSESLDNKCKRKDRLKRLIQERSKRVSDLKENTPTEVPNTDEPNTKISANTEVIKTKESETDMQENKDTSNKSLDKNEETSELATETLSVSDDSNYLESDVDELNLLQKLHSGNEAQSSSFESSDSESPIAISDSLESNDDSQNELSDVISIENSSYSESEVDNAKIVCTDSVFPASSLNKENDTNKDAVIVTPPSPAMVIEISNSQQETEYSNVNDKNISSEPIEKEHKSNNDESNEPIEDILLASSDDENSQESLPNDSCVNLRDDLFSVDETVIGNVHSSVEQTARINPNILSDKENSLDKCSEVEMNETNNENIKDGNIKTSQNCTQNATTEMTGEDNILMATDDTKSVESAEPMIVDETAKNSDKIQSMEES